MHRLSAVVGLLFWSASAFAADTLGATPVKTTSGSALQSQMSGADGSTKGNIQSNNTAPGSGGGLQVLTLDTESSAPTCTAGRFCMPWGDVAGRLHIVTDAAVTLRTDLVTVAGAAPSATNPLWTVLTDGATAYTGAKTGQLPSALGQTTMAASVSVTMASNQSAISVTSGAPTGAATNRATAVNIASAGTTTITCKGSLTVSQPVKLYRAVITSAAQVRCTIQYDSNASLTTWGDVMTSAAAPTQTFDCIAGFCGVTAGSSGTQAIEASCTNNDAIAQDVVCAVQYCQAASGC